MPKSIGKRWVAVLIAVLLLVVSAVTMAFFTDRVDHSMQFTTASFSADGYTLKRTAPEGPFCAGEDVTATLKESNTGEDAINSVISMKATWVSPDTALSIFGNANAADNAKLSIDGTDISYKVSTDKKSITFDLPAHVLTAGTKDKARDLTLTIPASFKSTGRIEFTFEKVVVAQDGGGFSETYDRTQLNASKELDYSVRVGWAASSIEAQNGKALMGYLTEKDSVSGKFGIQFEYAFNYNTSPMKDFASKTDAKWSYYKDKAERLTFVEGMTSIGDYAFPDFELVTSLSLPESLVSVGKWSFDNISIPTLTLPAALTNFDTMSFGHINELTEITFNQAAKTDISFPTAGSTTGAFYVDPYVPTKIVGENPIAQGYDWITDQRRVAPVIRSYNYTWSGDRMSQPLDATTLTPDDDSNVDFHTAENRAKIRSVVFQDASGYYAIPDMKPGDAGGLVEKNNNMWDVSAAQNKSVIAWLKDDGTLIIAGDGVKVMANADSDWLFGDMANIETIDATLYDTSNATTMEYWHAFAEPDLRQNEGDWSGDPLPMEVPQRGTKQIVGIQDWDVSKVTSTMDMFYNANRLTSLNLGSWNTKSLKTPNGMFHGCSALTTLDVSGWNTSKVTTLQSIFSHCRGLTALNVAGWDVQKVTDMSFAFSDCGAPVLDLHTWKTNSLTTLEKAFAGAGANTINVTGWNTSKVITMDSAFENTASLGSLDLSTWDTSGVGRGTESDGTVFGTGAFNNMFFRSGAKSINVSGFDFSSLYGPKGNWNGGLYKMFGECKSLTEIVGAETWTNTGKIVELNSTFIDCEKLVTLNVSKWDTSGVTAMSNAFNGCKSLAELDVSKWDVSSCEGYINTFKDCESVKVLDISKWDMTKATPSASQNMFNGCKSLESLTFPTSVNWLATRMAANCPKLTTIEFLSTDASISQRPTAGASLGAFYVAPDAGVTVPVTTFIITHGSGMAQLKDASIYNLADDNRCLPLDLPVQSETLTYTGSEQSPSWNNFDATKMTVSGTTTAVNADTYTAKFTPKAGYAWEDGTTGAKSVTWKIGKAAGSLFVTPTEMTIALNDTTGTITVTRAGDGAITATSDKTSVATVAVNGNKITVTKKGAGTANITVKVAEGTNHKAPAGKTVVVTCKTTPELNAKNTWYTGSTAKSAITEIALKDSYIATGNEIESWDASAAQNKTVMAYVVEGTNGKKLILAGNGSGKIVANADSTSAFNGFTALTAFTGLDKLDTSNVTNMQTMFNNLDNIQTLDLSSFNTSKVTNFYSIFGGNDKLTTLNLTGWDTSAAKDMGQMFYVCNALTTINGLSSFNTANVTDMSGMFHGCKAMTSLDLSNFNTAKVKTLSMMFYQCSNLETVKLTSFDTSNVTNLYAMFQYCSKLKTVDLSSFNTAKVTTMRSMFGSCKAVESLDLSSFDTSAVTNMSAAFDGCQTLQTVTLGKDFKFVGTDGYLPAPSATYISGADRNWYVAGTDTGYTPTELAAVTRVRNVTYSAVKSERIGGLDVGESVFLNVDGKRMEFIVVNQGNPDTSIYDDSCNGTWLLMKDIYENRQWHSSDVNKLESSTIHSYLNSTFLNLFDSNIRDAIKQVKLPYRKNGGYGGTDQSGANGLSCKVFLLSGPEVGLAGASYMPNDGAKLDYFNANTGTDSKRIAYLNGSAASWWLRSPHTRYTGSVWGVNSYGSYDYYFASSSYGIRPALVLPSTVTVDNDRNVGGSTGGGGGDIPADLNLAVPKQVGTLTANGSEQSPTWKNYDSSKMTISGTTSAVKAGTYTATFTLNDGYAWFDGTAEDKDVQWTMESGAPMLAASDSWYKSSVKRGLFTKIEFIDSGTPSGTIVEQWNADVDNSGSIKAYITGSSGDYTLTIAGNGSGSIMANPDSTYLFGHEYGDVKPNLAFSAVTNIAGMGLLDTSKVTTMNGMFVCCRALGSLDVSGFDTSSVTNMAGMFSDCQALTSLDLSGFNTSKVTSMNGMFYECENLTTLDVSKLNTAKVEGMSDMFFGCRKLTALDVSGFDTSSVTDMYGMFYDCSALTSLDLSGFDTSRATNMSDMFYYCIKLQAVTLGKDFKFVGTDGYLPTPSSTYISGADGKWYDSDTRVGYTPSALASVTRNAPVTYVAVKPGPMLAEGNTWYKSTKVTGTPSFKTIAFINSGKPSGTIVEQWNADVDNSGSIKAYITGSSGSYTLTIAGDGSGSIMANPNSNQLFKPSTSGRHEFSAVTSITGLGLLDTSKVTIMSNMFRDCKALTSLDLSGFDTSSVTSMASMFESCEALTSLDVSGFDTSSVTNMNCMFYWCTALTSLDLSGFDTSNVTSMSSMFYYCIALTSLNLSGFDTSQVTNMSSMFLYCKDLTSLDLSGFDTSQVTSMRDMFEYCTKLQAVTLGKDFKFVGTDGYLYTPSSTYISGADGKWYDTNTGTGYTPEALASVERTEAVTYSAVPNAKILSGMWKFNVKPAECPGNFEGICFTSNGVAYSMIGRHNFSSAGQEPYKYYTMWYAYAKTTKGENRVLCDYSWDSSAYRLISFNGPQVVTEEFYNWFVENAKPVVTLEGKWKFNETLTFDTEVEATEISYTFNGYTGTYLKTVHYENGSKFAGWNFQVDSAVVTEDNVYSELGSYSGIVGWQAIQYRYISFNGTQYVTKDFYDWFIANAKPWSEDESGAAEKIAVPKQIGTLTYTGSAQSPSWSNYDASKMTMGGTTTGTNAGSYTTTFALNDGFKWADGTTGTKSVIWKIGKATGSVSFSKDSLSIDKNSTTDSLDVTRTGTGAITATSSDTSVATVTVNGTKVTVTKVGDGTATITIKVAADTNYKEASKTCSVTCVGIPTLAYGSTWYKGSTDKASISKIQIKDSYTPSGTAAESWNADARNSGSIKAYVEGTTLTIAGNGTGKIKANALSWSVFNGFSSATAITGLDLMDTSNALTMEAMFYGCKALTALDVSKFDTSNVTSMRAMFYECENLTSLNVSKFDTASVTNVEAMFQGCKALTAVGDVSGWNTAKVTSMYQVFYGCEKLAALDLSGWNTTNVTNMQAMFLDCTSLTSVGDISGWNTAKVTEMALMFGNCEKLASLDVSKFNTAAVTNMNAMFFNCSALTTLDVSGFDTAKTTNLAAMFSGCVSLTSLDVSNWNTSNVTTMEATFQNCKKLTTMGDVSGWDTSKVTNMREMFCQCNLITSVDVTNWKTGNVTNMNGIFSNCEKLTSVGDLSGWDTSSATDMGWIFNSCFKLTGMGDISQWDTSNATKMNCLFATCESLTELDLSGWDTSKVTDMNNIFGGYKHEQLEESEIAGECVLLRKITLGAKFKFVGTDSYLPEPDSRYISGADGKWYVGSMGYTPAELAGLNRTEAVTYVAVKGTKTMSILSGDNAVSGYSISE